MRKSLLLFSVLSMGLTVTFAQQKERRSASEAIRSDELPVSLVRLIATPERYHNKRVQVIGYLNLEFEGNAIYLHREDYEKAISKNGFRVSFSKKVNNRNLESINKQYVILQGIFNMEDLGHMGAYSGEIKEITILEPWNNK